MSAGQPDWNRLLQLGKLPEGSRGQVPLLAQLDAAEAVMKKIEGECCDDCRAKFFPGTEAVKKAEIEIVVETVIVQCEVEGCEFGAKGRSEAAAKHSLRLHSKTHIVKE